MKFSFYTNIVKTIIDTTFALFAFVTLIPLWLVIAVLVKLSSPGPVFYTQERLGKNGKVFKIIKFRSMRVKAVSEENTPEDYYKNPRITKLGKFLRRTSLDEFPQLLNVLMGQMSLIGPRPPLTYSPKTYEDYNETEKIRFTVKPGMSGLAQVRNRFIDDWDHNIKIDIEYVRNLSPKLDLLIFLKTLTIFFAK